MDEAPSREQTATYKLYAQRECSAHRSRNIIHVLCIYMLECHEMPMFEVDHSIILWQLCKVYLLCIYTYIVCTSINY